MAIMASQKIHLSAKARQAIEASGLDLVRLLALAKAKRFRLVVLYGSFVNGGWRLPGPGIRPGEESDIDIGFLPGSEPAVRKEFAGLARVKVDAKDLTPQPGYRNSLYRAEVAATGVCVYEDRPGAWAAWKRQAREDWRRDEAAYLKEMLRETADAKTLEEIKQMSPEELEAWLGAEE